MKLAKIIKLLPIIGLVLTIQACKKYGVEVPDGYDDASGNQSSVTVDTNMKNIDRSAYAKARLFPGLVDQAEPRVQNMEFTLNLNFTNQTAANLRISAAPEPMFSTGFYAAPGELIKIIVPANANGLSMQIGGHTDNLTNIAPLLRDPIIYNVKALYPGVNYVRNIYGGTIYIKATIAIPDPVKFVISGAVVSPDFVLGVDTDAGWKAKVLASKTPWLEMRAKRVIFLVPTDKVVAKLNAGLLDNPTALMTEWNNKFELDYNEWMGLSDNATDIRDLSPQGPWRGVLDIQLSLGYGHSGIPFVGLNDQYWFDSFTTLSGLLTGEGMWGTYHEFGHNCQQNNVWSWSTLGETTNNLFSFKVANRMNANYNILHRAVSNNFPTAIAWATSISSTKNFDSSSDVGINDPFSRMTPFVQIFEKYGYDAMTRLYTEARHTQRLSINDIDKHDFTYEKLSDAAQIDLSPFFDAWGITISKQMVNKVSAKYPLLTTKIWTYNPLNNTGGTAAIVPTILSVTPAGGTLTNLIDNNTTTTWVSTGTTYPHNIVYSQNARKPIKGVFFNQASTITPNNQRPKDIEILISDDNVNYTSVGTTTIPNNTTRYNYSFPAGVVAPRYIKVTLKNGHVARKKAELAEMGVIIQ